MISFRCCLVLIFLLQVNSKIDKKRRMKLWKHLTTKWLDGSTTELNYRPGYSQVYTEGDVQDSEDFHRKPLDEFPEGHWVIPPPHEIDKFKNPGTCQTDLVNHLRGKWRNRRLYKKMDESRKA